MTLNETSTGYHPYILGANKTTVTRGSVLTVFSDTTQYPRVGSPEITSSAGTATFSGLHLVKPEIGIYNLTFTSADPSLSSASVLLTITPGASKHLGLLPYCSTSEQGCQTASNCTCQWYRASAEVSVHPFIANVLDGGFNPVGVFETRSCETCERRAVQLSKTITLCRVRESGGCECAGVDSATSKLGGALCSPVVTLDLITVPEKVTRWSHSPRPICWDLPRSWCRAQVCSVEYFLQIVPGEPKILYSRKLKRVKYLYPHCTQGSRTRHIRSLAECMMAAAIFLQRPRTELKLPYVVKLQNWKTIRRN